MVFEHEYDSGSQRLTINCRNSVYGTSVEDSDMVMAAVIGKLSEIRDATTVVLSEVREYEYGFYDVRLLREIANIIERIRREGIISLRNLSPASESAVHARYSFLQQFLTDLKYDPLEAYKDLEREYRISRVRLERAPRGNVASKTSPSGDNSSGDNLVGDSSDGLRNYFSKVLQPLVLMLESSSLVQAAKPEISEHKNRSLYRKIFHPTVRPNFMYTRYMAIPPERSILIDSYSLEDTKVEIYQKQADVTKIYHIIPPEFRLDEQEYSLLDEARRLIGAHQPRAELVEPEQVRESLFRIGVDLLRDLAASSRLQFSEERLLKLASILARYTAGIGILEVFLKDENIQDIVINSPIGSAPVYIYHGKHEQCVTNIIPTYEDAESWATRFRLQSGRPLDNANPVLDTEFAVSGGRARVTAITRTLSPEGLAFAIRRHREQPWTLPLFIRNRMIDPFSAGLLWFIVDGSRTMLVAGTRSSGKTSLLGALIVQIMPKYRIITVEDTLELPVSQLKELGYNIERLKSRSVITNVETELAPEEALRTALRLGDSALIVGEVRSREALALYEAMRIGALANVVAGTIHGDSVYGVYDRVVNDLGVPPTSFKATDIIITVNMLRTVDGLHSFRRVTDITEVRKHWSSDPLAEGGFVKLLDYSSKDDVLKPTKTLLTGESVILDSIASRVREWKGNWDGVWDNINLRARILGSIASLAEKKPSVLEAPFVIRSNSMFHIISEKVKNESGSIDSEAVFSQWNEWLKSSV